MRINTLAHLKISQRTRLVWYFIKPHRALLVWIVLVTTIACCVEGMYVAAFLPLFHALIGEGQASAGGVAAAIMAASRMLPWPDPIVSSALLILIVIGLKAALTCLREALVAQAGGRVLYTVKNALMDRYGSAPYQFFIEREYGTLMHTCAVGPHKVAVLILRFPQFVAELVNSAIVLGLLCAIWTSATLALAVIVLGYHLITHRLARQVSYFTGRGRRDADAVQFTLSNELFVGARHLKVFDAVGHWLLRFREANQRYTTLFITDTLWLAIPRHVVELTVIGLLVGSVLFLRVAAPAALQAQLPLIGMFALALMRLIPSITNMGRIRMEMAGVLADAEQVYEALTMLVAAPREGTRVLARFERAIELERVSFAYPGRAPVLNGLSLVLEKGKTLAIVGCSGAGKTTLLNLVLGLLEPTAGRVLVDGVPLHAYQRRTWLAHIGLVAQEPFIYHGTVAENILFGRIGFDREAVVQAARLANAHEFIMELPQQYDTRVGERGMKLSGGQQQRLAIARALLHHPDILLLDEATSHLDRVAEQQVQTALERALGGRTVLLITHRLSTIVNADYLYVLDGGRVVEEGTYQALMQAGGPFARMAQMQLLETAA